MKRHHTKRRLKDRPKDYYRNYERRRKNSGKLFKERFKFILKRIRKFLKMYRAQADVVRDDDLDIDKKVLLLPPRDGRGM